MSGGGAGAPSRSGLFGTLLIVKPGAGAFDVWALVGLIAAVCSALRDLSTRAIGHHIPTLAASVYGATAVMLCGAAFGVARNLGGAHADTVARGCLCGRCSWGSAPIWSCWASAMSILPAVAPFRYTLLLWMGLSGYFAFGEVPDGYAMAGAVLIALSGLYALHREGARKRELAATAIPPA